MVAISLAGFLFCNQVMVEAGFTEKQDIWRGDTKINDEGGSRNLGKGD
jgi:hypothetical protein